MGNVRVPLAVRQARAIANVVYQLMHDQWGDDVSSFFAFPRDVKRIVQYGFNIPVKMLPELTLSEAGAYLCVQYDIQSDRALKGLLHVGPPATMILVKEHLQPDDENYVIAHELGHYLHDVFVVQRLWQRNLQEQEEAIQRAFSWQELDPWLDLQAILKGLPQRPQAIVARGQQTSAMTMTRERAANAVAVELLAPWEDVTHRFEQSSYDEAVQGLQEVYGLPRFVAEPYARDMQRFLSPRQDLFDQLFSPLL